MRKIELSVLISLYKGEKGLFLSDALSSIEVQTVQPDEVIIVHDGPLTEELYDTLNAWRCRLPIKDVILEKNVGLGFALNEGLKNANMT
ncbi:glycosyltransferase [Photobacterium leiognathi]|uniref:glycosyltransferase n=1 Tax=Photobacterium leiognathi TaxID=553611 RepID=UPI00273A40AD|nr:glycosyltransferase [Photobacterium leiognathi]